MDTLNKIVELLKENKRTQQELMVYLGLEKSTFSSWKSGKSKSYTKYIDKIAEFFNVSTDYLLKGEEPSTNDMPAIYFSIAQNAQKAQLTEHDVDVINKLIASMIEEHNGED